MYINIYIYIYIYLDRERESVIYMYGERERERQRERERKIYNMYMNTYTINVVHVYVICTHVVAPHTSAAP